MQKGCESHEIGRKLDLMELRMDDEASEVHGQLCAVVHQNSALMHKV